MIKLGIITPVEYLKNDFTFSNELDSIFVDNLIQRENTLNITLIDLDSVSASGSYKGYSLRNNEFTTGFLKNFDIIHFLDFEHPRTSTEPLNVKWKYVIEKLSIINQFDISFINSIESMKRMIHKDYLASLRNNPKTNHFTVETEIVTLEQLNNRIGLNGIVKPINGENGDYVYKLNEITENELNLLSKQSDKFIIQPILERLEEKEYSILYIQNRFSHAIQKSFKSQDSFNPKSIDQYKPTKFEIEVGHKIYKHLDNDLDIFRFDYAKTSDGIKIIEMESVDPYHYYDPDDSQYFERMIALYKLRSREKIVA